MASSISAPEVLLDPVENINSTQSEEEEEEEETRQSYESLNRMFTSASSSNTLRSDASTAASGGSTEGMTYGHFVGAVANLCSATLGAGILALPFAMYESGLIFGLFLLLASGWGTAASIDLIVQACDYYQLSTYETVVEKALGTKWRQLVEISILIFCGGTAVAYVIAVGDIMERVEDVGHTTHKKLAMTLVWLLAMLPLSCLRRMQSLQCASSVGIISIGTLLVAATVHLFVVPSSSSEGKPDDMEGLGMQELELFLWPHHGCMSVLRACPIFFFAYSCQVNVAQIYDELPGPRTAPSLVAPDNQGNSRRIQSMSWVAWVAIGLCTLLYGSVSFVTLLDFGNDVEPNILSCYHLNGPESALLHLAFMAMAVAVIMAFPLNVFPARVSIIQMWEAAFHKPSAAEPLLCSGGDDDDYAARQPLLGEKETTNTYKSSHDASIMERGCENDDPLEQQLQLSVQRHPPALTQLSTLEDEVVMAAPGEEGEPEFHLRQHQFVTLLVAGCALGLALVVPNISVVFGLLGGTTSSLLGFVVPGMLGLAMEKDDDYESSNKTRSWVLVIAGTLIGVVTTGVTLYSTFRDSI